VSDENLTVAPLLPASLAQQVQEALERASGERVRERVREGDATLWGPPGAPEIGNRLGWLTIAQRMLGQAQELEAFAAEIAGEGVNDVVLLGMGGSSLAPEVLSRAFGGKDEEGSGRPAGPARVRVLDSTNAGAVRAVGEAIDAERTLFLVSSKSGGTIEPLSMLAHFWSIVPDGRRFAAITDPGSGLEKLAMERGFRRVFHGDPDIGGRYSALSAFGIVPAALLGVDLRQLLSGAEQAWQTPIDAASASPAATTTASASLAATTTASTALAAAATETRTDGIDTPAWLWLGVALAALAKQGRDKLTFLVPDSLDGLGLWLEQLFAESTGKQGTGILPVAEEPLCDPGAYGGDRVFVSILDLDAPDEGRAAALRELAAAGHPTIEIPSRGRSDLGRLFMLAELCVAVAGWGLQINPFDQPNVQEAKDATNEVLSEAQGADGGGAPASEPDADVGELQRLLGAAHPPAYVALMGYVQPSPAFDAAVSKLRAALIDALHVTTTFGYGPRFLHSTGQFHKGGPPVGRFLQLVHDTAPDVEIPGKPYTFTLLEHAQADGDLHTLRAHQLPAARVTLRGADAAAALEELTTTIISHVLSEAQR